MRNDSGVLNTGVLIDDRYRLDDRLGTGGMGDVWRATDVTLGRAVAVKVLLPALLADPKFGSRFRAEARMLAALHHPGVVRVYDYGESTGPDDDPIAYLVMEYVEGEPLSERLAGGEPLPVAEAMTLVVQAARALHAAHTAGIVHRDVKPSNLLLRPDGSVKLVDFGVARSNLATTGVTSTNAIIGTAMYMAPEQASGATVSAATDIYALGAVAYHCLAGKAPFTGNSPLEIALRHVTDDPPELPASVPTAVRDLVRRALAKDPAGRYPTAAAFAKAANASAKHANTARGSANAEGKPSPEPVAEPRPAVPSSTTLTDGPIADAPHQPPTRFVVVAAVALTVLVLSVTGIVWTLLDKDDNATQPPAVLSPSTSSAPATAVTAQPTEPEIGGGTPTRRNSGWTKNSRRPDSSASGSPTLSATPTSTQSTTSPSRTPTFKTSMPDTSPTVTVQP